MGNYSLVGGPVSEAQPEDTQRQYLELMLRAGELLSDSLDYQSTLQTVCRAIVEHFADICLLDIGSPDVTMHLAAAAHRDPSRTPNLQGAGAFLASGERRGEHPVRIVVATGEPLVVTRVDDAYIAQHATSEAHERFMREMRYGSMIIAPLISQTQGSLGALTLVRTGDRAPFREADVAFTLDLARRCASAIGKAMLYEETRRISTLFQRAALPHALPAVPGISFDAVYEPSSEDVLVGGDWYDAFVLPDQRVAITVGDVLGHGIEAAVWMSRLRNSLRATLYTDPDPARALVVVDHLMRLESEDAFTTALVAIIDPIHQTMSCASAGHPGPMIFESDGSISDRFVERTLPLGLRHLGNGGKTAQTITLRPGTFAVFFTDGLLEWDRDVAAAWDRMLHAVARQEIREAAHPAALLREAVLDGERHQDDIAILTMRIDELVRREVRP